MTFWGKIIYLLIEYVKAVDETKLRTMTRGTSLNNCLTAKYRASVMTDKVRL